MTIEVKETDLIDGSAFSWNSTEGVTLSRAFMVTGIEGNKAAKPWLAANADGIPKHKDEHPDVLLSYVVNKTVNMLGAETGEVIVEYAPFKSGEGNEDDAEQAYRTKRVSGSVQSVETNKALEYYGTTDKEELMNVEYEWAEGTKPGPELIDKQVGTVRKEDAILTMEITKIETTDPFNKILTYQGTMNSVTWSGGGPRSWFLREISSTTDDGGETWTVSYRFQYRADNWDVDVAYIDPRTGAPPKHAGEVDPDTGIDQILALPVFRIYRMTDFNKLGIGG